MKTISPFELQKLIDKSLVELIDVRPRNDFNKIHVQGARSVPWSEFEPHAVLSHRKSDLHSRLYIMARGQMLASLVACSLVGAGLANPIVVDGGIEEWQRQCLPVVRKRTGLPVINPSAVALLAGLAVALSLAFRGNFFFAALFLLVALAAARSLESAPARFRFLPWARERLARSQ